MMRKLTHFSRLASALLLTLVAVLPAGVMAVDQAIPDKGFPITITNCGYTRTFEKPVRNAIVNNLNMMEIIHALDLNQYVKAMTGVTGPVELPEDFVAKTAGIPELTPYTPGFELLVWEKPDIFIFGWGYGITPGGAITPERLSQYGIHSYALEESCTRIRNDVGNTTLATLYTDFINLSRIFGEPGRGEALVTSYKKRVASVQDKIADQPKPRVLLFDGTPDDLVTSGSKGMGHGIIEAAGGINVAQEMATSWAYTSIEAVIRWNPDYLIFRRDKDMAQAIQSVIDHPVLGRLPAVRERRFTSLSYAEMVPGARVVDAIERVASTIHPSIVFDHESDHERATTCLQSDKCSTTSSSKEFE